VLSIDRRDEVRAGREAAHAQGLTGWPELHACFDGAKQVGPIQMMSRWHGFFRESAGPGWVLVGDAGHFKDPSPGQGIADALRQVVHLAPAVQAALDGSGDQALRDWWAWRDHDAWEMYWLARDLGARGRTPPVFREIQRRVAEDPRLAEGLVRVMNHDVPPSQVFTASLAARAVGRALRRNPGRRRAVIRETRALVGAEVRRKIAARRPPVVSSSGA